MQALGFMDVLNKGVQGQTATQPKQAQSKGFMDVLNAPGPELPDLSPKQIVPNQPPNNFMRLLLGGTQQTPDNQNFMQRGGAAPIPQTSNRYSGAAMGMPESEQTQPTVPLPKPDNFAAWNQELLSRGTQKALEFGQEYLVDPFEHLAQKGAKIGGEFGQYAATHPGVYPGMAEAGAPHPPAIPPDTAAQAPPAAVGISRGIGATAGAMAADPRNYPLMLGGFTSQIARRLMSMGFSAMMAKAAIEQSGELGKIIDNPSIPAEQKYELGTSAVLNTLMAAGAGAHAGAGKEAPPPQAPSLEAARPLETARPATSEVPALPIKDGRIALEDLGNPEATAQPSNLPGEIVGYAAHDGKPIIDMQKPPAQGEGEPEAIRRGAPAETTEQVNNAVPQEQSAERNTPQQRLLTSGADQLSVAAQPYVANANDIRDAVIERVIANPEATEKLTAALQQDPLVHIPDPSESTLRWYTSVVLNEVVDGQKPPFSRDVVEAIMKAVGPDDLLRFRDMRRKETTGNEQPEFTGDESSASRAGLARVPVSEINLDPQRFQFKTQVNEQGVGNLLKGQRFNEDLAGVVNVWRDPANGETYVVNGHHRVVLARETGQPEMNVRYLNAPDAVTARTIGALQNIAEGRGTAVDAAKFFRDSGYAPEDLDKAGISMGEATARNGLSLSRLTPFIFDAVATGRISEGRGIAIGEATADPAKQEAILKLVDKAEDRGKNVSNETVAELARMVESSGSRTEDVATLFGTETQTHSTALEKAEVSAFVKKQLANERRVFGSVSSEAKAGQLAIAGNKIKAAENRRIATEAGQLEEAYNTLSTRRGPVDDILEQAAQHLAKGGNPNAVKTEAYQNIRQSLSSLVSGAEEGSPRGVQANPAAGKVGNQEDSVTGQKFLYSGFPITEAFKNLSRFYNKHIAEPTIQKIGFGRTHLEVEREDPALAKAIRIVDNAPIYWRAKAENIVKRITGNLDRNQERLFALMADESSRENLKTNHPEEYRAAQSNRAIQQALEKYKPSEEMLREARRALGGTVIEEDYLKRVYDKYTAGIGKREGQSSEGALFNRVITPERTEKYSRDMTAEYHYQHGLHEFGPAFGTKYVATMLKLDRNNAYLEFASKATKLEQDRPLPNAIEYRGKTYLSPDAARDAVRAGRKNVKTYAVYDSGEGKRFEKGERFLGPRAVVDGMRRLDSNPEARKDGGFKRFLIENTIGFGLGVGHTFNVFRRISQSFPGGVANPAAWVKSASAVFSRELKARGISGVEDPTFDSLLRHGGISPEGVSTFKKYVGGNLNPGNWLRVISKVGHNWLFSPGGVDQRARLYIADLVKSQRPDLSDAQITERVREQLGNYNRVNWTTMQEKVGKFMLFPGWDTSSFAWVIRHPVRTTVPAAILILTANNVINALGGNKSQDRFDFSNVHFGDRAYGTSLVNEPIARKAVAPLLSAAVSKLQGQSNTQAVAAGTKAVPRAIRSMVDVLRPDLLAPFEAVANKDLRSGDIVKTGDFSRPGRFLPNKAAEDYALFALKKILPEAGRVMDTGSRPPDYKSIVGGTFGVPNYKFNAENRIMQRAGKSSDVSKVVSEMEQKDPEQLRQYFKKNPDAAVYTLFHGDIMEAVKDIHELDRLKESISGYKGASAEDKKQALTMISGERERALGRADAIDSAVQRVLEKTQQPPKSVADLPFLRNFIPRSQSASQ
jgi:hypothetical protein